jgi:hypothetical protein
MTAQVGQMLLEVPDLPAGAAASLSTMQQNVARWTDADAHRVAFVLRGAWIEGNEARRGTQAWDRMTYVVLATSRVWMFRTDRALEGAEDARLAKALWSLACAVQSSGQIDAAVEVLASSKCPQGTAEVVELCETVAAALA